MFYEDGIGNKLRFGDVVKGFLSTCPILDNPMIDNIESYTIEINTDLSVVLDPCCSIGSGTISISPLIKTLSYLWDNPHLFSDITEINRKGYPKDLMPPARWNKCTGDEKTQFLNATMDYGYKNLFIYKEHPLFAEYEITRKKRFEEFIDPDTKLPKYNEVEGVFKFNTRYYMIDFKNIRHINCKKVIESEKPIDEAILNSIVLQLSEETRDELRNKMGDYFARTPNL
jgi:hypothetical protein